MKISVITVTYNVADSLPATLASIAEQTYPDVEMVLVDGGSTDGTLDIIRAYEAKGAIVRSEPDHGIYDAMNKGVGLASGEYVLFLNAGDCFAGPEVVAGAVALLRQGPAADYAYGNVISRYAYGDKHSTARPPAYLPKNKPFNHQALFARRSWLEQTPFDLRYRFVADYDQTYAAYRAGAVFRHLPLTVAVVDMAAGASKDHYLATMREKIAVNWARTDNKARTAAYLLTNVPYLLAIYGLRRLGLFDRIMAARGRQKEPS